MAGLLADGWFYISSAGLLVSGVLFFFLLGQYRAATDAADQPEPEAAAEPHPVVRPVYIPEDEPAPAKVASVSPEKPAERPASAPASETAPAAAPTPAAKRPENTTGSINPAVVYLQNIKNELAEIHKENRELAKRVEAITSRDEALIERLSELAQAVAELKNAAPATAASPEAAPATPPTLSIEPTTSSGVSGPKPAPKTEPTAETLFNPDETVRLNLKPAEAAQAPAPAEAKPAAAAPAEEPESDKPRRGPVWPV
ncbi:MAG TPA: hypothetical protein VN915_15720 [Elusimicrobiota bacterium]|nr:hypothetical protein [Elusimicrobiota bacterium]